MSTKKKKKILTPNRRLIRTNSLRSTIAIHPRQGFRSATESVIGTVTDRNSQYRFGIAPVYSVEGVDVGHDGDFVAVSSSLVTIGDLLAAFFRHSFFLFFASFLLLLDESEQPFFGAIPDEEGSISHLVFALLVFFGEFCVDSLEVGWGSPVDGVWAFPKDSHFSRARRNNRRVWSEEKL